MKEYTIRKLPNNFKGCDFMTKGAEGCRKNTLYLLRRDKKEFRFCKPCIENCQNHPEYEEDNLITDIGDNSFVCECALGDHANKFKKGEKETEGFAVNLINIDCPFANTLKTINSGAFFKVDNQNLCLFCYFDLSEQSHIKSEKLKNVILSDQKICNCNIVGCDHSLRAEIRKFRNCLKYILSNKADEKNLRYFIRGTEIVKFFYHHEKFANFFTNYFKEVVHAANTNTYPIDYIEFESKNEEFVHFGAKDQEIWQNINDFLIIKTNLNVLIHELSYDLNDTLFCKSIDLKILNDLFSEKVKISEFTFNAQLSALHIFYNTFILPMVSQHTSTYFSNDLNLSPIHRLMFFKSEEQFLADIGGKKKIFELFDKIMLLITQIHEDRQISILSKIKDIKHLVLALLKYLTIFEKFSIRSESLLDKIAGIINDLAKIIYFLMNNTKTDPISSEPNNLEYIYRYLANEKKFDQEEIYDRYTPTNIIRLRFEKLIKMLMVKQNDLMFRKAFEHEGLSKFDFNTLSFTFENNKISRKILAGLLDMGFQKVDGSGEDRSHMGESTDIYINKINDVEICQILFHEDDCYINGLKGLFNCYVTEKLSHQVMKDIVLERDKIFIPNNLINIFKQFENDSRDYFSLKISNQNFSNLIGNKCKEAITILLQMLNLVMNPITAEIYQTSKTKVEDNYAIQIKFAKKGYLEILMKLIAVIMRLKLKNNNGQLDLDNLEEQDNEYKDLDSNLNLKSEVILLLLKCLDIITYMNPFLSITIFSENFLKTLSSEPYLQQKTLFLKKKLNDLDANYYRANLHYLLKYIINPKNILIMNSDTTLVLSLIKHILKMNNNNVYSNLSDILRDLMNKLIDHFSDYDNPVIKRYINPNEEIPVVTNPIPKSFGNFYFQKKNNKNKIFSNEENLKNLDYEEGLFKTFQKMMYYINNPEFFNRHIMKNHSGSLEYFSLFTGKVQPKVSILLLRNIFHYNFRYPRMYFEYGSQVSKQFISEPLFWVNDKSKYDKKDDKEVIDKESKIEQVNADESIKKEDLNIRKEEKETRIETNINNMLRMPIDLICKKYSLEYSNKTLSTTLKDLILVQVQVFNKFVNTNPQDVKNRESFYVRFFKNTVVIPSMIYIYKTILVTKVMSIMQKYEIYEVILNLLNSFSIFLEEITNAENFDLEKLLYINEKRNFFKIEGNTPQDIVKQSKEISSIMKTLECNDPTKLRDNMKILEQVFPYFRLLEENNTILMGDILSDFIDSYAQKKLNSSNNVLKSLLNLNDVKTAEYKKNAYFIFMKDILTMKYLEEKIEVDDEEEDGGGTNNNKFMKIDNKSVVEPKQNEALKDSESKKIIGKTIENQEVEKVEIKEDEINIFEENNKVDSMSHLRFVVKNMSKVILIDPELFQSYVLKDTQVDFCRNIIGGKMIPKIRQYFPCQIMGGFFLWDQSSNLSGAYGSLLETIEFLRVLCEGHNQAFQVYMQTIDLEATGDGKRTKLNNFLFKINTDIIEIIEHYLDRQELIGFMEKETRIDYFFKLYKNITNFFIEIIQGSFSYVFLKTFISEPDNCFYSYHDRHMLLLENLPRSLKYSAYVACFLKLVDNILQEKVTTDDQVVKDVLETINNDLKDKNETELFNKVSAFPHLYIVRSFNYFNLFKNAKFCLHYLFSKIRNINISTIKELPCSELLDLFKNNEEFQNDVMFSIATTIFIIIKNLALKNIHDKKKAASFMKSLEYNNEQEFQFLSRIIRTVELNYTVEEDKAKLYTLKDKILEQDIEESVLFDNVEMFSRKTNDFFAIEVFLIDPLSLKLEENDIEVIMKTCEDITNLHAKQTHLLEYVEKIISVVKIRKEIECWNPLLRTIAFYSYTQDKLFTLISNWISVTLILAVNLILMCTLTQEDYFTGGSLEYLVYILSAIQLFFGLLVITILVFIDGFFDIRMDKKESIISKFSIFVNFVVCIIALPSTSMFFFFSVGLFSIVPLISVMRIVIIAIYNRTYQFLSAGILLIFFILIFAAIGFFFLRPNMKMVDDSISFCTTYISCFLNQFTYGLRDLGVQDQPYILTYSNPWFWGRFVYDWMFFFFTLFILINIFNGIVVDTFQSYREKDEEIQEHLRDVCYICHLSRNDFSVKDLDFEKHRNDEHSLRDYIDFLIKIKTVDENDLNNLGTQTLILMKDNEPSMFPVRKSMSYNKII